MAAEEAEYDAYIQQMRENEYPMLKDTLYLDHAGATVCSKTLMDRFHADMLSKLYGNTHSASPSSQRSSHEINDIRLQALSFFGFDPEQVDLIFTANTTAAIKLVMEAFRESQDGFWYGYHVDSHTSLVGVREASSSEMCFETDQAFETWLNDAAQHENVGRHRLFAYPAQSNMNGRRLPSRWSGRCRSLPANAKTFTMLDAASFAATSPLRFDCPDDIPDFTVLSFCKAFGFPDLGALVVRKDAAHIFDRRKYFSGGTVDMVVCLKERWHVKKSGPLHQRLEDGTLPIHNILALKSAMRTHRDLFRSMDWTSRHTMALAQRLRDHLRVLVHANGRAVCAMYEWKVPTPQGSKDQGPIVAFNLRDSAGIWVSNAEVEKLAAVKDVQLRTGGLCNPGGIATALDLAPWEMRENFSAGFRCGTDNDIMNGKPTGVIRVSLGAMSTRSDVDEFISFIEEFFVSNAAVAPQTPLTSQTDTTTSRFYVESLMVYPIKSCAGWQIPYGMSWDVRREGLAWDREWCIVDQATGITLSQKNHPRMALVRPQLDFRYGVLRVSAAGCVDQITVPLSQDPSVFASPDCKDCNATVCGDSIKARRYVSPEIAEFFTKAIGVACTFARFPAAGPNLSSTRHSKPHLQQRGSGLRSQPLLLSNESPILTISRSSLNRLNEYIKAKGGKAAHAAVFRANIVLAESLSIPSGQERPWAEDDWHGMRVGGEGGVNFALLGGCRRCQMLCIDQHNGEKNQEPFVTLAKTRRMNGKIMFGT